jgi:hypothetical protein
MTRWEVRTLLDRTGNHNPPFVGTFKAVAKSIASAHASINRRRSDEMLDQFAVCPLEVTEQVQKQRRT